MVDEKDTAAPAEKPVARIVGGGIREKTVPLNWPVEYDGTVYESVTIRRCSGTEISDYIIAMATGQNPLFPGLDCPIAVYDALDADDFEEVDAVVKDFLPRRFRQVAEAIPEASGNTSTKSDTPLAAAEPK